MSKFIDTEVIRARAEAAISNGAVNHDLLRALLDALARAKAEGYNEGAIAVVTWLAHELMGPSPANPYRANRIDPTEGTRG